jgi:hypothetical protein
MFWDSSAIIPLCVDEPMSRQMKGFLSEKEPMVAWWGTFTECCSAFARLRRDEVISEKEEDNLRQILQVIASVWSEIRPVDEVKSIASRLL